MQVISNELRDLLLNHPETFGYCCEYGACIGDHEFIVWEDQEQTYLVHKSEIEEQGFLVRLKKEKPI